MAFNFKNSEEVKDYLKNIYTEYLFGCESEKKGEACHLLADYHELIKKDWVKAGQIYKSNCDERNWARSCTRYGEYLSTGKGCTKNIKEAYGYMRKACDFDDDRGCANGALMAISERYTLEETRAKQEEMCVQLFEKACNKFNDAKSCHHLAAIYIGGLGSVKSNPSEAFRLSLKCCEQGNPIGCANLSVMYKRGFGVEKNEELAKSFKERAIALHDEINSTRKQLEFQKGT